MGALMVTWIHVIAAMFWIGGMLFFSLVLMPCLKNGLPDGLKADLISLIGKRFRFFGWFSLGILLITGLFRLFQSGWSLREYGGALKTKLILVFFMVLLTLLHDLVLGQKTIKKKCLQSSVVLKGLRFMARVNLFVGLLIVLAALSFVRGF